MGLPLQFPFSSSPAKEREPVWSVQGLKLKWSSGLIWECGIKWVLHWIEWTGSRSVVFRSTRAEVELFTTEKSNISCFAVGLSIDDRHIGVTVMLELPVPRCSILLCQRSHSRGFPSTLRDGNVISHARFATKRAISFLSYLCCHLL